MSSQNWCFLKRFAPEALATLPEDRLHGLLTSENRELAEQGQQVLLDLGIQYLQERFPKLGTIASLPSLSRRLFAAPENLSKLSNQYGAPSPTHLLQLIGALGQSWGPERVLALLQKTFAGNALLLEHQQNSLLPPALQAYPIAELSQILGILSTSPSAQLVFKLHQESGRLSNNSIYIVGVYHQEQCLGEGYGPSLAAAQQRACLDALRRKFLRADIKQE